MISLNRFRFVDRFGRPLENLRISVNSNCNYRCIFCHKEGVSSPDREIMSPEEVEAVVRVAVGYGVRKVKITGGEPLLREDLEEIVRRIKGVPGVEEVSLVTNGYFLEERVEGLSAAGLDRLNVSLHSMRRDVYREVTGVDGLEKVFRGIEKASKLLRVKLNMVILRGINEGEYLELIRYASRMRLPVQLIELEDPDPHSEMIRRYWYPMSEVEETLKKVGGKLVRRRSMHNRPVYLVFGTEVVLVPAYMNPDFCMHCNRIRVTSDGKFKPCLFREDNVVPFLNELRSGGDLDELFRRAVVLREPYYGWYLRVVNSRGRGQDDRCLQEGCRAQDSQG